MFQYPSNTKIVSKEGNQAIFEISPLYPGYGITVANVLRRVLVSSIEGAAVTAIRIKGVDHEFSTIPNVMEDVVQIILNLKKVRFKSFKDEPVTLTLKTKGEKTVKASDIESTSDVEVISPDQDICTITDKKGELEMEITIEKGVGYVPVEQRQKDKLTVGEIAIDGIFTPIKNVTYTVDNVRVGQRTDFNKILLDLTTDGSITPEEAFQKATEILKNHFDIIGNIGGDSLETTMSEEKDNKTDGDEKPAKKSVKKKK